MLFLMYRITQKKHLLGENYSFIKYEKISVIILDYKYRFKRGKFYSSNNSYSTVFPPSYDTILKDKFCIDTKICSLLKTKILI